MFGQYLWLFVVVCLRSSSVNAVISSEEKEAVRDAMEPFFKQCIEELGMKDEQVEAMKNKESDEGLEPCFMSCFLKKTGIFTSDGKYDGDRALELTKDHIKNEDDLAIIDNIGKDCAKVNDAEVSDGEEGCERALLLYKCLKGHKDEIDLTH